MSKTQVADAKMQQQPVSWWKKREKGGEMSPKWAEIQVADAKMQRRPVDLCFWRWLTGRRCKNATATCRFVFLKVIWSPFLKVDTCNLFPTFFSIFFCLIIQDGFWISKTKFNVLFKIKFQKLLRFLNGDLVWNEFFQFTIFLNQVIWIKSNSILMFINCWTK